MDGGGRGSGKAGGFVTSRDVARRAGVSSSAVSRTFTPGASVSPGTRKRVLEAAEALGYRVNRLAQGLISDRSILVGVLMANMSAPYMARQLDALSRALLHEGMHCLLLNAEESEAGGASRLISKILEFRARAIVVMSGSPSSDIVRECMSSGVRVILVNKRIDNVKADTILSDDVAGSRLAVRRLIEAGCRRPVVVASGAGTLSITRRMQAAVETFIEARLRPVVWAQGSTSYESGVLAARETLADSQVDGAFCVTDLMALGYLDAARVQMGRKVPQNLRLVGFDDIPQASWQNYDMTTIRQPADALVAGILRAIQRDPSSTRPVRVVLPVELVERGTVVSRSYTNLGT